ncbi:MAG: enoyl-CoA hydratase/isomerase family protein [Acidobacteriota bacterium]|nr:enoyl-CoA hydratase/isomerase family protein [Acidobacteriota bacterium]
MSEHGSVEVVVENGVGSVIFFHPKSNSLPGPLLREIADTITGCGEDERIKVVVLKSAGERAFCAGASFSELVNLEDESQGKEFFMGFARVILAVKNCPKFVIARVQGKAIGGGVGVASAADYTLAHISASVKLSELALGLGPFVVGPACERKLGTSAFSILSIDNKWRDAEWAHRHGLYADVYPSHEDLDDAVNALAAQLAKTNPEAMAELKRVFWKGTDHWDTLLEERAEHSGRLALSQFTRDAIAAFASGKRD